MKKILLLSLFLFSCAHNEMGRNPSSIDNHEFVNEKLVKAGIAPDFIKLLQENYRPDERDKVIDLNLLGFLRANTKNGNLDPRIPMSELARVKKFLKEHKGEFTQVEKKYKVPKEVIASLLWVETKYGRDIGTFHIGSVFYSLAQADHPDIVKSTIASAKTKVDSFDSELEQKIRERSVKKALWAIDEIKALESMQGYKDIKTLKGSFAGAFGMAQFIPSSYLSWAKTKRKKANLFRTDDSIQSVANYLKSNGWVSNDLSSHEAALFHYNRDKAYVERILRMSNCLKKKRVPSAKRSFC